MELCIYDGNLNELGIVDEFSSLIWTMRFYQTGVFELKTPLTENNVLLLQKNRYIYRPDVDETGIIKSISEEISDGGRVLTVSGSMLKGLLDKRFVDISFAGNGTLTLYNVLLHSLCDPSSFQFIPCLYFNGTDTLLNETILSAQKYENLGESVRSAIYGSGYGLDLRLSPQNKTIYLESKKAADRSADQKENPQVIFSNDFENISDMVYSYSEEGCYNYIRIRVRVEPEISGFTGTYPFKDEFIKNENGEMERYLIYDLYPGNESGAVTDGGAALSVYIAECSPVVVERVVEGVTYKYIDLDKTYAAMDSEARTYFNEYTENFSGTADGSGYRSEWELGDYVSIEDAARMKMYKKQIEEVTEVFEGDHRSVSVTFGENLKTILDIAKG